MSASLGSRKAQRRADETPEVSSLLICLLLVSSPLVSSLHEFRAMPVEHVIFIPAVLILGVVIGYVLGARAARAEIKQSRERAKR